MITAVKKVIIIPAKYKIIFSGSPDKARFNKLFKVFPPEICGFNQDTYEYWIAFLLGYLKDKGYDIVFYNCDNDDRIINLLRLLEDLGVIKNTNLSIKDSNDLKNVMLGNDYYSNDSLFISDDLGLMEQCEILYPENRIPEIVRENEKGKLLNYSRWHESRSLVVDRESITTMTPYYQYNAHNDLYFMLPDLTFYR